MDKSLRYDAFCTCIPAQSFRTSTRYFTNPMKLNVFQSLTQICHVTLSPTTYNLWETDGRFLGVGLVTEAGMGVAVTRGSRSNGHLSSLVTCQRQNTRRRRAAFRLAAPLLAALRPLVPPRCLFWLEIAVWTPLPASVKTV